MTDDAFLAGLEAGTLPESEFRHADHVRAAYLYLVRDGFAGALGPLSAALRGYAAARGKPERYHETVTVAFLALINERLHDQGAAGSWAQFRAGNADLFEPGLLARHYSGTTLASPKARAVFLLPPR